MQGVQKWHHTERDEPKEKNRVFKVCSTLRQKQANSGLEEGEPLRVTYDWPLPWSGWGGDQFHTEMNEKKRGRKAVAAGEGPVYRLLIRSRWKATG